MQRTLLVSLDGKPVAETALREAAAEHVALVVMTTHARSAVPRGVMGSVAEYVVAHSPAPTLLVRGGYRRTPQAPARAHIQPQRRRGTPQAHPLLTS